MTEELKQETSLPQEVLQENPDKIDVSKQPTSIDRFNVGSSILAKALAASKKHGFKPVALSFTDLEFLQHVVNAGISAAVQYSNLTSAILRRDPEIAIKARSLLESSDSLLQNLSDIRVGLIQVLDLGERLVKLNPEAQPTPEEQAEDTKTKNVDDGEELPNEKD